MNTQKRIKNCILHIGMPKTGTSSIQSFLYDNRDNLGPGVAFADMGVVNHTRALVYACLDLPRIHHRVRDEGLNARTINTHIKTFKHRFVNALTQNVDTIIFSGEGLFHFKIKELNSLKKELLRYVETITIVAYVRPPISFMESAFQQNSKTSITNINSTSNYPVYKKKFSNFEKVFGSVRYHLFVKEELKQQDVIKDFCHHLSIQYTPNKSVNESLSLLAIKFLHHFQRKKLEQRNRGKHRLDLERFLSGLKSSKLLFPQQVINTMLIEQEEEIEWMVNRLPKMKRYIDNTRANPRPESSINFDEVSQSEYTQLIKLTKNEEFAVFIQQTCNMTAEEFIQASFYVKTATKGNNMTNANRKELRTELKSLKAEVLEINNKVQEIKSLKERKVGLKEQIQKIKSQLAESKE